MEESFVFQYKDDEEHRRLSLYSFKHPEFKFQLSRSRLLPIYTNQAVFGNRCDNLYFFTNFLNEHVVCDFWNSEFKTISLPSLEPPPHHAIFHACGIGRDPNSRVYKVVFVYNHHFSKKYYDYENRALIYSFDSGSFKSIQCPQNFQANYKTVYIGHKLYWTALIIDKPKPPAQFPPPFIAFQIVSFNFRTEQFSMFPLPPYPTADYKFTIVGSGRKLGAVGYSASEQYDIWVHRGHSWTKRHCFHLGCPVENVLAVKDKRFVFVEVPCEDDESRSKVHVHDIVLDMSIGILDIKGKRRNLSVFSYVKGQYRLPDGKSMISSYAEVNVVETGEKKKKKKKKKKKEEEKTTKKLGDDEFEEVDETMIWKKNDKKKKKKKSAKMLDEDGEEVTFETEMSTCVVCHLKSLTNEPSFEPEFELG